MLSNLLILQHLADVRTGSLRTVITSKRRIREIKWHFTLVISATQIKLRFVKFTFIIYTLYFKVYYKNVIKLLTLYF